MRVIGPTGIVETARLILRPWREDDTEELQRLFSNPAVRGARNLPSDRIAKFAEASLRQWRVNGFGPWAAKVEGMMIHLDNMLNDLATTPTPSYRAWRELTGK